MTLALKMADARYDGYEEGFDKGREDGLQVGLLAGLQQGIERGAHQTKLETAKNLLAEGLAPQVVARCTNLPLDVIQGLL